MNKDVWWQSIDEAGFEHLRVKSSGENIVAESTILRFQDKKPCEVRYRISIDSRWRVREIEVSRIALVEKPAIRLFADGAGNWTDGEGNDLPEFAGCYEVDISATPLTNTLPIKRSRLAIGESTDIAVVYFLLPEMTVQRSEQRYTRIEKSLYRFEENGLFKGFTADLPLDDDELVIDYPELFKRLKS